MSQEEGTAAAAAAAATSDDAGQQQKQKQSTKSKVAIVFGYVGFGFYGLQHNFDPTHPTIEAALIESLHAVGYISDENMMGLFMKKIAWERASRTDKGVSALRNVVSCRLQLPVGKSEQEWVAPLNAALAAAGKPIRVDRIILATSSFDCYLSCTGRIYEYLLPTYCLLAAPAAQQAAALDGNEESADSQSTAAVSSPSASSSPSSEEVKKLLLDATAGEVNMQELEQQRRRPRDDLTMELASIPDEVFQRMCAFRLPPATLAKLRGFFKVMEGTNSFHNFTPSASSDDPASTRFIRAITVSDPYTIQIPRPSSTNGDTASAADPSSSTSMVSVELVRIQLDGQSFMLNQIRKMIGCAVEACIRGLDAGFVRSMFQPGLRRITPMAPANGLFLCRLSLDTYNHKLERIQAQGQNAGGRQPIVIGDVAADDPLRLLVERSVSEHEAREQYTARWVASLLRTKPEDFVLPPFDPNRSRQQLPAAGGEGEGDAAAAAAVGIKKKVSKRNLMKQHKAAMLAAAAQLEDGDVAALGDDDEGGSDGEEDA